MARNADEDLRMTFTEHLGELRDRIIYAGIALVVAFVFAYAISDYLFFVIARPLDPLSNSELISWVTGGEEGAEATAPVETAPGEVPQEKQPASAQWVTLNPIEGFMVKFKLAIYFGLMFSLPVILYQICAFIFPGLNPKERKLAQMLIAGCSVLGTVGVMVAYFMVFPLMLPYLLLWTPEGVEVQLRMNETVSIVIVGLVGFAVAFQFPMAVLALVYVGVLTPKILRDQRRIAIVGMAVVSAIFTPPDPISMLIMLCPLVILYELSIIVASVVMRKNSTDTDIVPAEGA